MNLFGSIGGGGGGQGILKGRSYKMEGGGEVFAEKRII